MGAWRAKRGDPRARPPEPKGTKVVIQKTRVRNGKRWGKARGRELAFLS